MMNPENPPAINIVKPLINPGSSLIVDTAGLVLTAVYLPRLFEMTGYLKDGEFLSQDKKLPAVRLLDYVAFGGMRSDRDPLFNKLLCGLQLEEDIDLSVELPAEHKDAADDMMNAMIQHWDIGNTSIDGLRSAFLARQAELTPTENHWQLSVKPEPLDVLLDRIPWSYSIVKLQWMEQPVNVKW